MITPLREADADRAPRTLPYSSEAEQALVGALLIENSEHRKVSDFLRPEHFGEAVLARIYAAIRKVVERGEVANPITLGPLFDQDEALSRTGGSKYLFALAKAAPTLLNTEAYGRHIAELYQRRQAIAVLEDALADAYKVDLERPPATIVADCTARLTHVVETAPAAKTGPIDAGEDGPIPPRGWLLGNTFCRGFISGLLSQGGAGKTALRIAQGLSLTTGRPLTGEHVFERCRVLIICLEDTLDELRRRVRASRLHYNVSADDVRGWLYLWAPAGLKIAEHKDESRILVPGDLERQLRAFIASHKIDLVILDPLVKTHTAEENDNGALDAVSCILARLAGELNCAVDVLHHERKAGSPEAGDANRGRGASSFRDAARLLYTLTPMTEAEREQFGLAEAERRSLVRVDSAKVNIAPPSIEARWFRIVGVPLNNGTALYPHGDTVPVVEPWDPPDIWRDLPPATVNAILDQIERGPSEGRRYSAANRADDRAAWRVVREHCPTLAEERQCRTVISTWLKTGMIESRDYEDPVLHKTRAGLFVLKRPG